jgi:hypothetical protein
MRSTRTLIAFAIALFVVSNFIVSDVFASSNPIPGVGIVVKRPPGSSTARTKTDKDGNFKFTKLESGKYILEIESDDLAKAVDKMARKQATRESAEANAAPSKRKATADGVAAGTVASTVAETSVRDGAITPVVRIDEIDSSSGRNGGVLTFQWTQIEGPINITVGEDGTISGQLRTSAPTR